MHPPDSAPAAPGRDWHTPPEPAPAARTCVLPVPKRISSSPPRLSCTCAPRRPHPPPGHPSLRPGNSARNHPLGLGASRRPPFPQPRRNPDRPPRQPRRTSAMAGSKAILAPNPSTLLPESRSRRSSGLKPRNPLSTLPSSTSFCDSSTAPTLDSRFRGLQNSTSTLRNPSAPSTAACSNG